MSSVKAAARRTGLLYLLLAILGPINMMYIPKAFIVSGDAAATAENIAAGELTYRLGIYTDLACHVIFLLVALGLYALLRDVNRKHARLMVALVGVGVAVGALNLVNQVAPLILLGGADFWAAFTRPQLEALAMGFLRLRSAGHLIAMVFWALWLFPFGLLVIKSRFFPKVLGVLLIVGCVGYLAVSFTGLVLPDHRAIVSQVAMPFYAVGEVAMILYLVIRGAREPEHGAAS